MSVLCLLVSPSGIPSSTNFCLSRILVLQTFLKVQKSKIYLFICLANFILNRPKDAKKFESSSLTGKKAKVLREKGLYYVSRIGLIERRFH